MRHSLALSLVLLLHQTPTLIAQSLEIGTGSSATEIQSTALGANIVIGDGCSVDGTDSTGIGNYNYVDGSETTAVGASNVAEGDDSAALGAANMVGGNSSIAAGRANVVTGNSSAAVGDANYIEYGDSSIAFGDANFVCNDQGTAVGSANVVYGHYGTALGASNVASGDDGVALGVWNDASVSDSTAIGSDNTAFGLSGTAVGAGNWASGLRSTAVGAGNSASGAYSSVFGCDSAANGTNGIAIGHGALSNGGNDTTLGSGAQSMHSGAIVIGFAAASHADNTAVIGSGNTVGWHPGADAVTSLGALDYRFNALYSQGAAIVAGLGDSAEVSLWADDGSATNDKWAIRAGDGGNLTVESAAAGGYAAMLSVANNGNVTVTGDLTVHSDRRLKRDIQTVGNALDIVAQLDGKTYRWNVGNGRDERLHYGFVAQEVESVVPELVLQDSNGDIKSVNYQGVIPILVNAVKELQAQNSAQAEAMADLRRQLARQEQHMNQLLGNQP